ncbi:glycosyltransferase involved in cell wall biosynthesis [Comamonas sp. BIGb0152]|uniref:glycosyltransferase family 2 protein n=1 Tax=Comamonas sp. BIGb0152 TaxID=2940601 RepID=UPI00216931D7|nr:glycosyltransferase family 2 protein [Comamonas sp. BIGb0152]MCS4294700.1 glycosyltransferase involved in cell wall biosynthesis [Comamonas sp. BIGb0152]
MAILLSTFNGEQFLPAQLDSLMAQSHAGCDIWVRDDGSSDQSLAIVQRYADAHPQIHLHAGANLGFVASFYELLQNVGAGYDFYFFCDQDDVWLPSKVSRALSLLDGQQGAALYCSRTQYVAGDLQPIGPSPDYDRSCIGWGNALVQNIATGCTVALNAAARERLLSQRPGVCLAHDWWAYLVVSAFGSVVFDSESHILYRQHGRNTIGMQKQGLAGQWARVQRFWRRLRQAGPGWIDQLSEFDRLHGADLADAQRRQLRMLIRSRSSWTTALRASVQRYYWRMSAVDTLILRVLLALRLY